MLKLNGIVIKNISIQYESKEYVERILPYNNINSIKTYKDKKKHHKLLTKRNKYYSTQNKI